MEVWKDRYAGFFFYGFWESGTEIGPWLTSGVYFHGPGFSCIIYCHNEKRFADITLWSWINCFSLGVWALIFGVMGSVLVWICLRRAQVEECEFSVVCFCIIRSMVEVFGIIFRQVNCNCAVLGIFSLGMMIVLSLFENNLTSYLIAPTIQQEHTLVDLVVDLGYRVLYEGDSDLFGSHLTDLQQLLILNNVPFRPSTLQQFTRAVWNDINTFSYNKMAYYTVATGSGKAFVRQLIQSNVNSSNFSCTVLEYSDRRFPTYSSYMHEMKYKFLYVNAILIQAGIDLIFDQDLEHSTSSYAEETTVDLEHAQQDEFLSLKYLVNFFYFFGVACFTCSVIFMVEVCFSELKQVISCAIGYFTRCLLVAHSTVITFSLKRSI
jgi:hypothetical protein